MSELWLIRRTDNAILGPLTREEVSRRILEGEFGEDDEFCSGSGYWFFLHERGELKKWLGLEAPRRAQQVDDDATDTGRLAAPQESEQTDRLSQPESSMTGLEESPVTQVFSIQSLEEHTRKRGWNHPIRPRPEPVAPEVALPRSPGVAVRPGAQTSARPGTPPAISRFARKGGVRTVEPPSFFKGAAWVFVVAILLVIYALLRVLRTAA